MKKNFYKVLLLLAVFAPILTLVAGELLANMALA